MAPSVDEITHTSTTVTGSNSLSNTRSGSDPLLVHGEAAVDAQKQPQVEKPLPSFTPPRVKTEKALFVTPPPVANGDVEVIDRLAGKSMDDVVITPEAKNRIFAWKSLQWIEGGMNDTRKFSKVSKIAEIDAALFNVDELRKFVGANCPGAGKNKHNYSKKQCLDTIAKEKQNPSKLKPTKEKNHPVNSKRYLNVIFGDVMKDALSKRGQTLSKDELTEGIKRDQKFHEDIVFEYNKGSLYNEDEFEHVNVAINPAVFGPIKWQQSNVFFRDMVKDYEFAYRNWKKSGNHGDFGETDGVGSNRDDFEDYIVGKRYLLYMHEFIKMYPDILATVTGELPTIAFSESNSTKKRAAAKKTPPRRRRSNSDTVPTGMADEFKEFTETTRKKNAIYNKSVLVETRIALDNALKENRKHRRELLAEALERSSSMITKKDLDKEFVKYSSLRDAGKDIDSNEFSQDTIFEEVYDVSKSIESNKAERDEYQKKIDSFEKE